MIILGIDPGTMVIGYGVVASDRDELAAVAYGAIKCKAGQPLPDRLSYIYDELNKVIEQYRPAAVAVETPFVGDNIKSAFVIGKGQAVAILAAAQLRIPVFEYSPATVKRHVADYGASSKEQVQEMVKLLLNLSAVPEPNDAADALAVAICHSREAKLAEIMARGQ